MTVAEHDDTREVVDAGIPAETASQELLKSEVVSTSQWLFVKHCRADLAKYR